MPVAASVALLGAGHLAHKHAINIAGAWLKCSPCHGSAKIVALNGPLEREDYAMPRIRNGYTVSRSCGFRAALFSALLAIALFDPGVGNAQELKQVKFTEKHVQSFIAVSGEMANLSTGANQDKTDAELEVQAEALVKKYGFANLAEFDDVSTRVCT
jgi:hypothetical protein